MQLDADNGHSQMVCLSHRSHLQCGLDDTNVATEVEVHWLTYCVALPLMHGFGALLRKWVIRHTRTAKIFGIAYYDQWNKLFSLLQVDVRRSTFHTCTLGLVLAVEGLEHRLV